MGRAGGLVRQRIAGALGLCALALFFGLALTFFGLPNSESRALAQLPVEYKMGQRISELGERIHQLEMRDEGAEPEFSGALLGAKAALQQLRTIWKARASQVELERAERIVRANLALAERRYSLWIERALFAAAEARREAAHERARAAKAGLAAEVQRVRECPACIESPATLPEVSP